MSIIWGICLIFVGIGLLGNSTGFFNIFFKGWWTIFIIVPSIIDLFKKKDKIPSIIVLSIGIILLLQQQHLINNDMILKVLAAVGIITLGIKTLMGNNKSDQNEKTKK